jgi:PIN domain nuclease of toxin-antitoxin system
MLLIDTCILIWLSSDPDRLSSEAATAIRDNADRLYASAISAWEVAIGASKGRLELGLDPIAWFGQVTAKYRVTVVDLAWQVAAASVQLPKRHSDPADRLIIATAMDRGFAIVTPDKEIRLYPGVRVIW